MYERLGRWLLLCALPLLLTLAPVGRSAADTAYRSVLIRGVPHIRQRTDFCGEACAAMYLSKLGFATDQDFVFDQSGLDPLQGRGCYTPELAQALTRIGFETGRVWFAVPARNPAPGLNSLFRAMHADLTAGVPSIVCMHYDRSESSSEHFRLIVGYDTARDEIIYHEPAVDNGAYQRMGRNELLRLWPLKYEQHEWTVIRFRLAATSRTAAARANGLTAADYAQDVLSLKQELSDLKQRQGELQRKRNEEIEQEQQKAAKAKEKGEEYEPSELQPRIVSEFQYVLEEPFIVVGDESLSEVQAHAEGTIRWAVSRLKRDYFAQDPDHLIRIWLFRDKQSYEQNTVDIFRWRPHTPFGYYSPQHRALVMNIDTGGGTLVHEIVHPFMAANVPDCPAWFNEGLGSLYEQCQDKAGHIWGVTNWRLRGLQEAIKDEEYEMPTFEQLCNTSTREFYNDDPGTNYAQARYLCFYLQEQGLLVKYFHELRKSLSDDPGGFKTLQRVLGKNEDEMQEFQEKWHEFVQELRF